MRNRGLNVALTSICLLLLVPLPFLPTEASDKLRVRIWTDKDRFLLREPIIVHYELKNISDSDLVLCLSDLAEDFRIKDQQGIDYPRLIRAWCPPSDTLRAGEIHQNMSEVGEPYGIGKVGQYACYIQTPSHGARNGAWMESDTIRFGIIEPMGEEKEALRMFAGAETLSFSQDPEKRELAFSQYLNLVQKHPGSVYAPLSLYCASKIYGKSSDIERMRENVWVYTRLIEDYPEFYYNDDTFYNLVGNYKVLEDKAGAIEYMRQLTKEHPDTKISERAEYWLEKVEKWEFE